STYTAGTGVWTASGAIADVNTLLASVVFTPVANGNASFTIATSASDGALAVTGSKGVTGIAVNDAPVLDASKSPTLNAENEDAGDASTNGGSAGAPAATDTASVVINAVNDAPGLDASKSPALNAENEDAGVAAGTVGTLVSSLVDFATQAGGLDNASDVDA